MYMVAGTLGEHASARSPRVHVVTVMTIFLSIEVFLNWVQADVREAESNV